MPYLSVRDRQLLTQRAKEGDLLAKIHEDLRADIDTLFRALQVPNQGPPGENGVVNFEVPVGVVDGVNTTFRLSRNYTKLAVFVGGVLQNGGVTITYTDPDAGIFDVTPAPNGRPFWVFF